MASCNFTYTTDTHKHVIGNVKGAGIFYDFSIAVHNLIYCKQNKLTPVIFWGANAQPPKKTAIRIISMFGNIYFEPVSKESYNPKEDVIWKKRHIDNKHHPILSEYCELCGQKETRQVASEAIREYVKLKPYIKQKIESFYNENMMGKKTIGIHIRGTDKKAEIKSVNVEELLSEANKFAENFENCQFLVASDEARILQLAQSLLKRKVIYYDAYRSKNGKAIHWDASHKHSKAKLGEEVIIEAFLLARCDLFLHTCSNVSMGVLFLNPNLEHKLYLPVTD